VAIAMILASASGLGAQAKRAPTLHAFAYEDVDGLTQDELVRAVRSNDRSVLRVNLESMMNRFNTRFGQHLENHQDLANYLASLHTVPCPAGETEFDRVDKNGMIVKPWTRLVHTGEKKGEPREMCLADDDGRVILSLWCGNITPNLYLSKPAESLPLGTPVPQTTTVTQTTTLQRCADMAAMNYGAPGTCRYPVAVVGKSGFPWKWVARTALVAGGSYLLYKCIDDWCRSTTTFNINNGSESESGLQMSMRSVAPYVARQGKRWSLGGSIGIHH
jgi:hypothetical protein